MATMQQLASALALFGSAAAGLGQEFVLLNPTAGLTNAHSYEVSSDGAVVAGTGNGIAPINLTGWWWTSATGSQLVPPLVTGYPQVVVEGMSADGTVLAGGCYPLSASQSMPFISARGGTPQALPIPAGFESGIVTSLSDDGQIACGYVRHVRSPAPGDYFQTSAIWTRGEVMVQDIPPGWTASVANDVTDAGIVVGGLWDAVGNRHAAFRWTTQSGMVTLVGPPGWDSCSAVRVSPDGRVITGSCKPQSGGYYLATRWVDGGQGETLGALPGYWSNASGHSRDGRLVVGTCSGQFVARAFLYSDSIGMVDVRSFLISRGLTVPVELTSCADITLDASTLVGTAGPSPGTSAAWRAHVPMLDCTADCDLNGSLDVSDFICFLNLYARRSRDADCNGDGMLASSDFLCFMDRHAAKCK